MSTWEERMSQRAYARERAQAARDAIRERAEWELRHAEEVRQRHAEDLDEYLTGPPGGCWACWTWEPDIPWCGKALPGARHWVHGPAAVPGPRPSPDAGFSSDPADWCWHSCHNDGPVYLGPIPYA